MAAATVAEALTIGMSAAARCKVDVETRCALFGVVQLHKQARRAQPITARAQHRPARPSRSLSPAFSQTTARASSLATQQSRAKRTSGRQRVPSLRRYSMHDLTQATNTNNLPFSPLRYDKQIPSNVRTPRPSRSWTCADVLQHANATDSPQATRSLCAANKMSPTARRAASTRCLHEQQNGARPTMHAPRDAHAPTHPAHKRADDNTTLRSWQDRPLAERRSRRTIARSPCYTLAPRDDVKTIWQE
ncbi:hypothetical protein FA95DRAFT_504857 [Auriscalpium vulgare]|uniref:Uncharacterized protein n=1 Tax=Auriscalpium vulgare TaxID=40419 RepID=A0ACB8RHC3_9AGAM|nr:hypothetical protein FA95DRAFT_504857 [Auriscalpium vulgare]